MIKILIVDDEPRIRSSLKGLLTEEGYSVNSCSSGEEAIQLLQKEAIDLVMLDVVLPGLDGLEILERIRKNLPSLKVIMISGQSDLSTAIRATKLGAYNFFEKPLNPDRVLLELKNLTGQMALERKVTSLETLVDQEEKMIGNSPVIQRLQEAIERAAPSEGRVFIFGENGTGKELVARAIHRGSMRKGGTFVSLNCAALPQDLVESELFGYEKGAFTGAVNAKSGRFEMADGGSLFLDEVGDMGLETQAKLLRVLQENEAIRLGGNKPYKFNVRIISATNKDINLEIREGRFREDLYYRLNVIPLEVASLRDRKVDIPLLAQYFLYQYCEKTGKGMKCWAQGALNCLQQYSWPGNVRELKNLVERLIIMSEGDAIEAYEVKNVLPASQPIISPKREIPLEKESLSLKEMVGHFERDILVQGFHEVNGNISKLARQLKIDRANLHRKLKSFGIK